MAAFIIHVAALNQKRNDVAKCSKGHSALLLYKSMNLQETSPQKSSHIFRFILFAATLGAMTFFGVQLMKKLQNTPERVVQTFVQNLEIGEVEPAYARLSTELKTGREAYWKSFLSQSKPAEGAALVSQEFVKDNFNTYPDASEPQRFVYKFRLEGKEYVLKILTFKVQNTWVIGELIGSYK